MDRFLDDNPYGDLYAGDPDSVDARPRLGDPEQLDSILREAIYSASADPEQMRNIFEATGRLLSGVELGDFVPVPGWNEPGKIDEFVAKWVGSSESDPARRLEHLLVQCFVDLAALAEDETLVNGPLEADYVFGHYVALLMGFAPGTDAYEGLDLEPASEVAAASGVAGDPDGVPDGDDEPTPTRIADLTTDVASHSEVPEGLTRTQQALLALWRSYP